MYTCAGCATETGEGTAHVVIIPHVEFVAVGARALAAPHSRIVGPIPVLVDPWSWGDVIARKSMAQSIRVDAIVMPAVLAEPEVLSSRVTWEMRLESLRAVVVGVSVPYHWVTGALAHLWPTELLYLPFRRRHNDALFVLPNRARSLSHHSNLPLGTPRPQPSRTALELWEPPPRIASLILFAHKIFSNLATLVDRVVAVHGERVQR